MFRRIIYEDAQGRTLSARVPLPGGKAVYFATIYDSRGNAENIEIPGAKSPEDAFALVDAAVKAHLAEQRFHQHAQDRAVREYRERIQRRTAEILEEERKPQPPQREPDGESQKDGDQGGAGEEDRRTET